MVDSLVSFFVNIFGFLGTSALGKNITIFLISLMPILELRGGMAAARILGLNPYLSLLICIIANIIPIPFILLFIKQIFKWLKKVPLCEKVVVKLENRALGKSDSIRRYEFWGLALFVGIPLPGTGAWTGSLIAALLNIDFKKAILAELVGVVLATVIMSIFSYGLLEILF